MRHLRPSARGARRGAIAAQVALCMTALLGVAAVVLDGGLMLAEWRHAQAAADAAALAGADQLYSDATQPSSGNWDPGGNANSAAVAVATANGYGSPAPTVNIPPTSGPFTGLPGYVEVIVTYNQPPYFSNIFGGGSVPIKARAVACGQWVTATPAILALAPTGSGTISTNGNGAVVVSRAAGTTSGGNIIDDSNSSAGINVSGKNALVTDPGDGILTSGGAPGYSGNGTVSPTPVTGQAPTPDPLRFIPEPSQPAAAPTSTTSGGVTTYYPGYYGSGLSLKNGTFVLSPGIYYMNGAFSSSGNKSTSVTGNGVTIFLDANGSLDLEGNGSVTLSPPTSGIYQGMTFFQSRSNTSGVTIDGNGSFNITGTVYAPAATVSLQGNGDSIGSEVVANQVSAGGNGNVNVIYNSTSIAYTRILNLVE